MGELKPDHSSGKSGIKIYRKRPDRTDTDLQELKLRLEDMEKKRDELTEENRHLKKICKSLKTIHGLDEGITAVELERRRRNRQKSYRDLRELYETERAAVASLKKEIAVLKERLQEMEVETFSENPKQYEEMAFAFELAEEVAELKRQMKETQEKLESQRSDNGS